MINRRDFIRIGVLSGAGLIFLNPSSLTSTPALQSSIPGGRVRKVLVGNRRRGCAAPMMSFDCIDNISAGVESFEETAFLISPTYGIYS